MFSSHALIFSIALSLQCFRAPALALPVLDPVSEEYILLPLMLDDGHPSAQIYVNQIPFIVDIDTGSSNLAVPSSSCVRCPTNTGKSDCENGVYSRPCGCRTTLPISSGNIVACPASASIPPSSSNYFVTSQDPASTCASVLLNNGTTLPFPTCMCLNAAQLTVPNLDLDASQTFALSSTCYGDGWGGFSGPIVNANVSFDQGEKYASTLLTAMTYMKGNFKCVADVTAQGIPGIGIGVRQPQLLWGSQCFREPGGCATPCKQIWPVYEQATSCWDLLASWPRWGVRGWRGLPSMASFVKPSLDPRFCSDVFWRPRSRNASRYQQYKRCGYSHV